MTINNDFFFSLHLTTMCIQYKPTVVACFCILLACKWSNWEIPLSNEKKEWYTYVDPTVTADLLQQLTSEFLVIFENCPSRLKEKIMAKQESSNSPFVSIISKSCFNFWFILNIFSFSFRNVRRKHYSFQIKL